MRDDEREREGYKGLDCESQMLMEALFSIWSSGGFFKRVDCVTLRVLGLEIVVFSPYRQDCDEGS